MDIEFKKKMEIYMESKIEIENVERKMERREI